MVSAKDASETTTTTINAALAFRTRTATDTAGAVTCEPGTVDDMPNWVENALIITGETDDIIAFAQRAETLVAGLNRYEIGALVNTEAAQQIADALGDDDSVLTFNSHKPEQTGREDWYEWRIRNWGCKWDASNAQRDWQTPDGTIEAAANCPDLKSKAPTAVIYHFSTPWSPPTDWLQSASSQHPTIHFKLLWNEEQGIAGIVEASAGNMDAQDCEPRDLEDHGWNAPYNPDNREDYDEDEDEDEEAADGDVQDG